MLLINGHLHKHSYNNLLLQDLYVDEIDFDLEMTLALKVRLFIIVYKAFKFKKKIRKGIRKYKNKLHQYLFEH